MKISPIGHIESPYKTKFGVPRQPGLADAVVSRLVLDRDATKLEHLKPGNWFHIIWSFSHNAGRDKAWSKTVRPPRLGGNKRLGVFATRSSFRPNDLALSTVQASALDASSISFTGGDMVHGTPVYAVIPYDAQTDAHSDASSGWIADNEWPLLSVEDLRSDLLETLRQEDREALVQVLSQDPRPAYTRVGQEARPFWTVYSRYLVFFKVKNKILVVTDILVLDDEELEEIEKTGNISNKYFE